MESHGFSVVTSRSVDLRENLRHLEGLGVEGAPDAAEIVADGFAEAYGLGAVTAQEAGLDKAFTDSDDDVWRPVLLDLPRRPEGIQEPLQYIISC